MPAPKGNRFWEARTKHGRDKIFKTPDVLWEACVEYFEWVSSNPLEEAIAYQGQISADCLPKMRAMTIDGLCNFLDIGVQTWHDYSARKDFSEVVSRVEQVLRQQKFEGASAGMLNPNIIARDLGLAERREHSGPDGGPIETKDATAIDRLRDRLDAINGRKVSLPELD